jgi:hypothetical protein
MFRGSPLLLLALALVVACGRPATEKECDEIVVRITELELKARGASSANAEEVKLTREALKKTSLRECVGRRISDAAMGCVRSATNAEQIVKECF